MDLYRSVGLLSDGGGLGKEGDKDREREENIHELLADLQAWEQQAQEPTLQAYLQQVKLISDLETEAPDDGAVSLMTVHASKGLEFDTVFVVGLEEGLFPHQNTIDENDVEEERRLCYVAMTRAQSRLILTHARSRRTFGDRRYPQGSRFLEELPRGSVEWVSRAPRPVVRQAPFRRATSWPSQNHAGDEEFDMGHDMGFAPGSQVWHTQYGAGLVVAFEEGIRAMVTVDFGDAGILKVIADYLSEYTP